MSKRVVIESPIIRSPFVEPKRHFGFDDEGITNATRRRSAPLDITTDARAARTART